MSQRRSLDAYPRPGVTVDLAILTVTAAGTDEAALRVLVQEREDPDGQVLPGRFLRERRTVVDTVQEVFEQKVGVNPSEVTPHACFPSSTPPTAMTGPGRSPSRTPCRCPSVSSTARRESSSP
ncbi:hypothetical protein [Janibacter sp. Soil728]|uniref:hypothetical protein n=1 Tax=Janibacter sp. Soil728 TaxID=1736393 RepID=UPI000A902919|nr:hypothetical protein [Janibacter sp. Soil728]